MLSRKLLIAGGSTRYYLYNRGRLYSNRTGGWNANIAFSPVFTQSSASGETTMYKLKSYNFVESNGWCVNELNYPYCPAKFTINSIDLTPWGKLCMEFEMSNIKRFYDNKLYFGAFNSRTAHVPNSYSYGTNSAITKTSFNKNVSGLRTAEIDLTNINQQGYIGVYFGCVDITQTSPIPDLKINRIWLER